MVYDCSALFFTRGMEFLYQLRKDSIGFKTELDCEFMYLDHVLMISR